MGHLDNAVDAGVAGRCRVDGGEMDDRVGLVGQFLQDGVGQRRTDELDGGVQVGVRMLSDAADRVSGRDQLPSDHPAELCRWRR